MSLLADGHLHSGSELASSLGLTRSAVWKNVRQLESLGINVEAQAGKGYRLPVPVELLSESAIRQALPGDTESGLLPLEVLWSISSTSDYLVREAGDGQGPRACLAEYQSGGRGRRGRQWFAPLGSGICLSVAWHFPSAPSNLSCLGLAAGVGVLRAVRASGVAKAMLKWPNDVVLEGKKLAGILIDVQGEAGGPLQVVAGVGLNYAIQPATETLVVDAGGLAPIGMAEPGQSIGGGRNAVAARLIAEITAVLREFESHGFSQTLADCWRAADCLSGVPVKVTQDKSEYSGIARGIAPDGQLLVEIDGQLRQLVTGDVSVRVKQ
jgi:BirA family biotin operon repressor/biotin-[acetyl-CoA-carboxylase] ligase